MEDEQGTSESGAVHVDTSLGEGSGAFDREARNRELSSRCTEFE